MLNLGFISQALQNLLAYFYSEHHRATHTYWFKKALYVYLILKCLYWLAYFPLYFGQNAIFLSKPAFIGVFKSFPFLLLNVNSPALNAVFLVGLLGICCFKLVSDKFYFVPEFIAWLLALNLHNATYAGNTGGDLLANQFLLFNCFLSVRSFTSSVKFTEIKTLFHNLAVLGIMIQLCVAYFLSAVAKLADADWQAGNAIAIVSQTSHFSLFSSPGYSSKNNWVYVLLNYIVLGYQTIFAIMAWLPFFKKTFLLIGVLMHLYIAFVMGLPWFGGIMILGYIFFWPFKKAIS